MLKIQISFFPCLHSKTLSFLPDSLSVTTSNDLPHHCPISLKQSISETPVRKHSDNELAAQIFLFAKCKAITFLEKSHVKKN